MRSSLLLPILPLCILATPFPGDSTISGSNNHISQQTCNSRATNLAVSCGGLFGGLRDPSQGNAGNPNSGPTPFPPIDPRDCDSLFKATKALSNSRDQIILTSKDTSDPKSPFAIYFQDPKVRKCVIHVVQQGEWQSAVTSLETIVDVAKGVIECCAAAKQGGGGSKPGQGFLGGNTALDASQGFEVAVVGYSEKERPLEQTAKEGVHVPKLLSAIDPNANGG